MVQDARNAPKLPGRWPLLGNLPTLLRRDAVLLLREAERTLGPVFWIDSGFGQMSLMVLGEEGFSVLRNKSADSSHLRELDLFLGVSMLTVDGDDHRRVRAASSPAFTPAGLSRAHVGEVIAETVARRVDAWRGRDRIDVVIDTRVIALEVIFRVMGVEVNDLPEWSRWYGEYTLGVINIPIDLPGMPRWRAKRARRWLEQRLAAIVADARARGDHDSMVGVMAHGRDESGAGMSERELVDNLLILGFAGHETTASTMAWAMFHLAHSPEHWDQLCDEAKAMDEVPTDFTSLAERAPLAVGIFRESLRLYPPVAQDSRFANASFDIAGYRVEPGTIVATSVLLLSRSAEHYDEPDRWQPERWLDRGRKPTPIENCQFGGGAHFCLGYHMALLEGTSFLVHAARTLADAGVRPRLLGELPKPRYVPLVQPPRKAQLGLG